MNPKYTLCFLLSICMFLESAAMAGVKTTVLHGFNRFPDGNQPRSAVVLDQAGNIYGTTYGGGTTWMRDRVPDFSDHAWLSKLKCGRPRPCFSHRMVSFFLKGCPSQGFFLKFQFVFKPDTVNLDFSSGVGHSWTIGAQSVIWDSVSGQRPHAHVRQGERCSPGAVYLGLPARFLCRCLCRNRAIPIRHRNGKTNSGDSPPDR
jgi:hypothetical protein